MPKYILKRAIMSLITAFLVATMTFFVMNMVPGGPFLAEKAVTPQAQAAMEAKYGLDKPLIKQYTTYMTGLLHGDFGLSIKKRGRTVAQIIAVKFPVSARIGGMALVLAVLTGVPLGAVAAFNRGTFLDNRYSFLLILHSFGLRLYNKTSFITFFRLKGCEKLCDAGHCSGPISQFLYGSSYALIHAGRYGTGLYENGKSQGSNDFQIHF